MSKYSNLLYLLIILSLVVLFGCTTPDPILIIITPTPDLGAITATSVPTLEPPPTNTLTATSLPPTLTLTQTNTNQPTLTNTPVTQEVVPTFLGPVIGEDYVLPTTAPPVVLQEIPTVTPTPLGPTSIPSSTQTLGPSPTPVPHLDASKMGLQLYSNIEFDGWMQAMGWAQTTSVGWVKIQVNWDFLQPQGPANNFSPQLQLFERQIEAAARPEGIRVLLSIAKAPAWTRSNLTESGPPDDPQALADFLTFILNDTKIGQSIDAIEIWNEPNLAREWRGTLPFNGTGYMQLFRPAYDAIRAYSPSIIIITAGLAPTITAGETVDDREFLQQMYDAGLSGYHDIVIGAHPYSWGNSPNARCCDMSDERGWDDNPHFFFADNLEATREIMVRNGHSNASIWLTEFGWATWEGLNNEPPELWMTYNSAQDQANYTLRAFEIGQATPYIDVMILWNLNFANAFTVERRNEIAGYSIINPVIFPRERPLFWQLAEALSSS